MTRCIDQYPDTDLTQEEKDTVARILAWHNEREICPVYSRILYQWHQAPPEQSAEWQRIATTHIRVCGCRVNRPPEEPDESWIFEEDE